MFYLKRPPTSVFPLLIVQNVISGFILNYLPGPPFTHQTPPEHMIHFGHTSCETDLERYLESLKTLWRRRSPGRETTVVINTMGWVKGQLLSGTEYKYSLCTQCLNMCLFGVCPQDLGFSCWWT